MSAGSGIAYVRYHLVTALELPRWTNQLICTSTIERKQRLQVEASSFFILGLAF